MLVCVVLLLYNSGEFGVAVILEGNLSIFFYRRCCLRFVELVG